MDSTARERRPKTLLAVSRRNFAPLSRGPQAVALGAFLLLALAVALLARAWAPPPKPETHAAPPLATPSPSESAALEGPTPEIRGHVLDAEGNAVDGATVRLVSASLPYTVYRDGRSDRTGAFSFPHVGPWRVRVVADHGSDGIVTSAALHVVERTTTEITLVLSAASAVRGIAVDAQNHPIEGAAISVEGVPWSVPAETSDDAGAFRLPSVPEEATSLVAVARGYRTARAPLGPRDDDKELVVRIVLTAADAVAGDVRDDEGNPVRARVVACEDSPAEARVTSAADGSFELPPSAIGCNAVAEHAELAPSETAEVVEGKRLALRLKAGGSIAGAVVDGHGAGLPAFTLGIESFLPLRGRGFDRTGPRSFEDARGAFQWDRLAPGTYVFTAGAPGVPPVRSAPIDVRGGGVTRDVRIVVAQGGILTGYVYDEAHAPLAGVDLRFDQVSSVIASKASARTDETGLYRLEGAPDGPSTLLASKAGFRTKLVTGIRVDSGITRRQDVALVALDGGAGLELGGIGAALTQTGGGFALGEVYPNDPAARAGLRAGDRILRIDGESAEGMSMADVLQRLRGEAGTSVGVAVLRPETNENVQVMIVRGRIVR
jgi:PDZ domain/Carboxypeptidase regulatory-like domain